MTTYTNIANSDVDADSAVTSPLMTAYRDNPIAIAEGAEGAPRMADAALSTTPTTAGADWVAARLVFLETGFFGGLAFAAPTTGGPYAPNSTIAGSNLLPSSAEPGQTTAFTYPGTYRCLGYSAVFTVGVDTFRGATLWMRVV